jgi:hypothetical protein
MNPIERVREGMRVLDATGNCVGTVAEVCSDRPGVTTTGPSPDHDSRLQSSNVRGMRPIELPRASAQLLQRIGYVTVHTGEPLGDHLFFSEDEIITVQRDTVYITHPARRPAA